MSEEGCPRDDEVTCPLAVLGAAAVVLHGPVLFGLMALGGLVMRAWH